LIAAEVAPAFGWKRQDPDTEQRLGTDKRIALVR
jgi:hypothetical protein